MKLRLKPPNDEWGPVYHLLSCASSTKEHSEIGDFWCARNFVSVHVCVEARFAHQKHIKKEEILKCAEKLEQFLAHSKATAFVV